MKTDMLQFDEKMIPIVYLPVSLVHTLFDDCEMTFVVNGISNYIRGVFVDEVPDILFALSSDDLTPYNQDINELGYLYDKLAEDCTFDRYPNQWEKSAPVIKRLRKGFAKRVLDLINHD